MSDSPDKVFIYRESLDGLVMADDEDPPAPGIPWKPYVPEQRALEAEAEVAKLNRAALRCNCERDALIEKVDRWHIAMKRAETDSTKLQRALREANQRAEKAETERDKLEQECMRLTSIAYDGATNHDQLVEDHKTLRAEVERLRALWTDLKAACAFAAKFHVGGILVREDVEALVRDALPEADDGNWHGAEPVRAVVAERQSLKAELDELRNILTAVSEQGGPSGRYVEHSLKLLAGFERDDRAMARGPQETAGE